MLPGLDNSNMMNVLAKHSVTPRVCVKASDDLAIREPVARGVLAGH